MASGIHGLLTAHVLLPVVVASKNEQEAVSILLQRMAEKIVLGLQRNIGFAEQSLVQVKTATGNGLKAGSPLGEESRGRKFSGNLIG